MDEIRATFPPFCKSPIGLLIADNSKQLNFGPFSQFIMANIMNRDAELVYFQDDDCVTSPAEIVAQWEPGKIVCNMPISLGHRANYKNQPDKLMGFGSVFERSLIKETFERYWKYFPIDPVCLREPGRIFTGLNQERIKLADVPVRHLEWAMAPDRLYRQADHQEMAAEARRRVRIVLEMERLPEAIDVIEEVRRRVASGEVSGTRS